MAKRTLMGLGAALAAAALLQVDGAATPGTAAASPTAAPGTVREFEGRVIKRAKKAFVQSSKHGKVRVKVNGRTRWEGVRFRGLRRGVKVETKAVYNGNRWVAKKVEREDDDRGDDRGDD